MTGHTVCRVKGLNLERFLRSVSSDGIQLHHVRRLRGNEIIFKTNTANVQKLEDKAAQGGWTFEGKEDVELVNSAFKTNKLLILLLVVVITAYYAASQCLFQIEIDGAGAYASDMAGYLPDIGIKTPMLKNACDLEFLREQMIWRYPEIAYIECSFRGTTLEIRVNPGNTGNSAVGIVPSCDVIASRGGIVTSVVTHAGTAIVKAGDIVRAGDVLIQGCEKGRGEETTPVCAQGVIMARVWETAQVSVPIHSVDTEYTGNISQTLTVETPWFALTAPRNMAFANADTGTSLMPLGGIFIPLQVRRSISLEHQIVLRPADMDAARNEATEAAMYKLLANNGFHDDFVDKWVEYSMIDNEVVCASAYGERIIDIAAY